MMKLAVEMTGSLSYASLIYQSGFHWLGDPAEPTDIKYAPNFALLKIWLSKFGAIHSHSATFSKTCKVSRTHLLFAIFIL